MAYNPKRGVCDEVVKEKVVEVAVEVVVVMMEGSLCLLPPLGNLSSQKEVEEK